MKKLDASPITLTALFPIEQVTLNHLQQAHQEVFAAILISLIGSTYDPAIVYKLYGIVASSGGPGFTNYSAGAVFTNGEVFLSPFQTVLSTLLPGNTIVANVFTAYADTDDPAGTLFSDGSYHQVHQIRTAKYSNALSGSGALNGSADTANNLSNFVPFLPVDTGWINITLGTGWIAGAAFLYRVIGNKVYIRGALSAGFGATTLLGTLPALARPVQDMRVGIVKTVSGTQSWDYVDIDASSGTITTGFSPSSGNACFLSSVPPYLND